MARIFFISTVNGCSKKKKPIMSCASSGHINKLKQSIFAPSISMMLPHWLGSRYIFQIDESLNSQKCQVLNNLDKTCYILIYFYRVELDLFNIIFFPDKPKDSTFPSVQ